jgi:hypothetical protein
VIEQGRDWADRLLASDPGLNRLFAALRTVLGVAVVLGVEYAFMHLTGALLAAGHSPPLALRNHQVVVIAMLLGGNLAFTAGLTINDETAVDLVVSHLLLILPPTAALAVGMELGNHRAAALASFAAFLGLGAWARRFGPRGANVAVLLFMGDFIGFFLHGLFTVADLGWLAAVLALAAVTVLVLRLVLFLPNRTRVRRRTQRSYTARAQRVLEVAANLFEAPGATPRQRRMLRRHLVRLNEAALIIDALLANPGPDAGAPWALAAHQLLFDLELTVTNLGRFAEALAGTDLTGAERRLVRAALVAVRDGDLGRARQAAADLDQAASGRPVAPLPVPPEDEAVVPGLSGRVGRAGAGPQAAYPGVIVRRLAGTITDYCGAAERWSALDLNPAMAARGGGKAATPPPAAQSARFEPAVSLNNFGALPGASDVSAQVATAGEGRLRLTPATRAGIQTAVAVGAGAVAGDALSPSRFYWAVLAAFISFLGVSHSLEQVRKAFYRVIGTLVGVILGSFLANAAGHRSAASLAVILAFLFLGTYLLNVNYTFMAIAVTVVVSQLYVTLGEFSNPLLLLRLEETAIGAVIAMLTGLVIVPVRTRRVAGAALAAEVRAIAGLVATVAAPRSGGDQVGARRDAARAVDSAYQAVLSATQPMRWAALGDLHRRLVTAVAAAGAARNYSRNLVLDVPPVPPSPVPGLDDAVDGLVGQMETLAGVAAGTPAGDSGYVRTASLFSGVHDRRAALPGGWVLAIRDLQLLDGALARLAGALGMKVTSLDVPGEDRAPAPARS